MSKTYTDLLNYFADRPIIVAKIEANTDNDLKNTLEAYYLQEILSRAFSWNLTPEAHEYWDNIWNELAASEATTQ